MKKIQTFELNIENDITKNTIDNICLSCISCNSSKSDKSLIDWIENSKYCKDKNIQLHPGKFYPACTQSEGFSFIRTLDGTKVGEPYTKKVLAFNFCESISYSNVLGAINEFNFLL